LAGQQLELPIFASPSPVESARIPRTRRVFVNRSLKMAHVDWVGFDMDYTLAIYNQAEMDKLSISATVEKLIKKGYPEALRDADYPLDYSIRGLLIDKKHGHVLKLDRFKHVQKGFHGLRRLDRDELRALYQSKRIRHHATRYHYIDTLYALSEVAVYAKVVSVLETRGDAVDYAALFDDIRGAIDEAHRDGSILDVVKEDLPRFVDRDPLLASTLHKLRSAGKKLFLLTNSRWEFTEKMMTYLLGGAMPEYPSFRHFFDAIVVAAQKPSFFQDGRPLAMRSSRIDGDAPRKSEPRAGHVDRGTIYEGGNLHDFERALGTSGDRILYVGDHIYGDILRSKRESAWRTAMIIQEMEAEVIANEAVRDRYVQANELMTRREELEDQLRSVQHELKDVMKKLDANGATNGKAKRPHVAPPNDGEFVSRASLEAERLRLKRSVERIRGQLRSIDVEHVNLERSIDAHFHPYWGSLLKEANDRSNFGDQVEEYACLYTSRVSNLGAYSPLQHFRSARDTMPHEF
jgi:5'-nucleotidase